MLDYWIYCFAVDIWNGEQSTFGSLVNFFKILKCIICSVK